MLFLGIGGIGISALAIAAKKFGADIVGYDKTLNEITIKLKRLGIKTFSNYHLINITNFDIIVYSNAISKNHKLLLEAKILGIKCLQRTLFLSFIMKKFSYNFAITGTHGKTTTSAILATLFFQLDKYSSFIIGGIVKYANSNAHINTNSTNKLVIEADESDGSFLYLNPQIAIINNIDFDHMATYNYSYENLLEKFKSFISKKSVKKTYLCIDDKGCQNLLTKYSLSHKNIINYGFSNNANVKIYDYFILNEITYFKILYKKNVLSFEFNLPGKYNVQNATACIIICLDLGFKYKDIKNALMKVHGVKRRFDIYKKTISGNEVTIIDDYAHHPVEITNSLNAVRERYPNKNIIHVFQPHRYTRNRDLIKDWSKALSLSDYLILLPTYSADEQIIYGAESKDIVKGLSIKYLLADNFSNAIFFLKNLINRNTVILIQGAGNITNLVEMLNE